MIKQSASLTLKKCFLFGILLMTFSSCTTILKQRYTEVNIKTNKSVNLVTLNDTLQMTANEPIKIVVKNGQEPLYMNLYDGQKSKKVFVMGTKGATYWANLLTIPYFGVGFLVDEIVNKKFTYPKKIFIDFDEPGNSYQPYFSFNKNWLKRKNKIGFSPWAVLGTYHPMVEMNYERLHGEDRATQISYGHLISRNNNFARRSRGFRLTLEEKFFVQNRGKSRLYYSVALEHLRKNHQADLNFEIVSDDFFNRITQRVSLKKRFWSITPRAGVQQYLGPNMVFDVFFGIGLRYRNTEHLDANPNLNLVNEGCCLAPDIEFESNRPGKRMSTNWDLNFKLSWILK